MPTVTVRYWAAAREAAGLDSETVERGELADLTVGAVTAAVTARHPDLAPVLVVSSLLVDGRVVAGDHALGSGDVLEVLPPFAGG